MKRKELMKIIRQQETLLKLYQDFIHAANTGMPEENKTYLWLPACEALAFQI